MSRILHLTVRTAAGRGAVAELLADASVGAGVEVLATDGSLLRTTAVLVVHDDRPDELVAIDVAVALRDAAAGLGIGSVAVRIADAEPGPRPTAEADGGHPHR